MGKKLTQEEVIKQFREVHGDKYDYSKVRYVNTKTKVEIICPIHGSFYQMPNNHKNNHGCGYCDGKKTHIDDSIGKKRPDLIKYFIDKEDTFKYSPSSNKKLKLKCPDCGFEKRIKLNDLSNHGFYCNNCNSFKYNYPELVKYLVNKEESKLPKRSSRKKVRLKCPDCGFEKTTTLDNLSNRGFNCNNCNSFENNYPELIKYLINKKDGKLPKKSNKKIKVKCPDCGFEKTMTLSNLSNQGFCCNNCNDGISIPEKFMSNLLSNLNIDFKTQYNPKWSENRRYDFYVSGLKMTIETHGGQHYKQDNRCRSLQQEKENDKLKKDLALKNGIKNYIIVDCRNSTFEWLRDNCIKELSLYFDLSNVDWLKIWSRCQNNLVKEACEAWNNKKENETTNDITRKFNLSRQVVIKYLNRGNKIGWCNYNGKKEMLKNRLRLSNKLGKKVCQYAKNGDFIKEYPSQSEASKQTKINRSSIASCCRGKRKTTGGYIWKYAE